MKIHNFITIRLVILFATLIANAYFYGGVIRIEFLIPFAVVTILGFQLMDRIVPLPIDNSTK